MLRKEIVLYRETSMSENSKLAYLDIKIPPKMSNRLRSTFITPNTLNSIFLTEPLNLPVLPDLYNRLYAFSSAHRLFSAAFHTFVEENVKSNVQEIANSRVH